MERYYDIPEQPPPTWFMPTWIYLIYSTKCQKLHWSVTIGKAGDHDRSSRPKTPWCQANYGSIMVVHYLAKLYGSILQSELSVWAERNDECHSTEQTGFWKVSKLWNTYWPYGTLSRTKPVKKKDLLLLPGFPKSPHCTTHSAVATARSPHRYAMGNLCTVWIHIKKRVISQQLVRGCG